MPLLARCAADRAGLRVGIEATGLCTQTVFLPHLGRGAPARPAAIGELLQVGAPQQAPDEVAAVAFERGGKAPPTKLDHVIYAEFVICRGAAGAPESDKVGAPLVGFGGDHRHPWHSWRPQDG